MSPLLNPASLLAEVLKQRKHEFNARFVQAKHARPSLDAEAFKGVLVHTVAPLVERIAGSFQNHFSDSTVSKNIERVVDALYDAALELSGSGLSGSDDRYGLATAWIEILPQAPQLLTHEPFAVIASVSNAAYNIARVPGCNLSWWINEMSKVAGQCSTLLALQQAGAVLAWRSGMARYRESALLACSSLDTALALAVLGLPSQADIVVEEVCLRLSRDPWLTPSAFLKNKLPSALKIVTRAGAFKGFGGQFQKPPKVVLHQSHFFVTDQLEWWNVFADAFGVTFTRCSAPEGIESLQPTAPSGAQALLQATRAFLQQDRAGDRETIKVCSDRSIVKGADTLTLPKPDRITTFAATDKVLLATTALSHKILVVGCTYE